MLVVCHNILIVLVFIVSQNKLLKNLLKTILKICVYFTLINLRKFVRCKLFYAMFSCTGTYNHLINVSFKSKLTTISSLPPPPPPPASLMQPSRHLGVGGISVQIPHSLHQKAIQMPYPSLFQF